MKKIVIYPAEILRTKTEESSGVDNELLLGIKDLSEILKTGENAAGLAAPQIGLSKRFFGIKDTRRKEVDIFINPKIIKTYGELIFPKIIDNNDKEEDFLEGCLSFPNYYGTVKRYLNIKVEWQEIDKEKLVVKSKDLGGFEAIVFQHELDHLNGVLFVDHIKSGRGKFLKQEGKEMIKWDLDKVIGGKL